MKKLTILLLAAFCIAAVGCSKDAEINKFTSEFEAFTKEVTTKLDADDIDGAKATFDAKKETLRTSFDSFKDARGFQVSEDTKKQMTESVTKTATSFGVSAAKAKMRASGDSEKSEKIDALMEDYKNVITM